MESVGSGGGAAKTADVVKSILLDVVSSTVAASEESVANGRQVAGDHKVVKNMKSVPRSRSNAARRGVKRQRRCRQRKDPEFEYYHEDNDRSELSSSSSDSESRPLSYKRKRNKGGASRRRPRRKLSTSSQFMGPEDSRTDSAVTTDSEVIVEEVFLRNSTDTSCREYTAPKKRIKRDQLVTPNSSTRQLWVSLDRSAVPRYLSKRCHLAKVALDDRVQRAFLNRMREKQSREDVGITNVIPIYAKEEVITLDSDSSPQEFLDDGPEFWAHNGSTATAIPGEPRHETSKGARLADKEPADQETSRASCMSSQPVTTGELSSGAKKSSQSAESHNAESTNVIETTDLPCKAIGTRAASPPKNGTNDVRNDVRNDIKGTNTCKLCSVSFSDESSLIQHWTRTEFASYFSSLEDENNHHLCSECGEVIDSQLVPHHYGIEHGHSRRLYEKELQRRSLCRVMTDESGKKRFQCKQCRLFLENKSAYDSHFDATHEKKKSSPPSRGATDEGVPVLKLAEKKMEEVPGPPSDGVCRLCQAKAGSDFVFHLTSTHFKSELTSQVNSEDFRCPRCGTKHQSKLHLMWHWARHHGEALKLYYCKLKERQEESSKPKSVLICCLCPRTEMKGPFEDVCTLRSHLFEAHLFKALESCLQSRFNINHACPYSRGCDVVATDRQKLIFHFVSAHGDLELGPPDSDSSRDYLFSEYQRRWCLDCGYRGSSFDDVLKHTTNSHPQVLDRILEKLRLVNALVPDANKPPVAGPFVKSNAPEAMKENQTCAKKSLEFHDKTEVEIAVGAKKAVERLSADFKDLVAKAETCLVCGEYKLPKGQGKQRLLLSHLYHVHFGRKVKESLKDRCKGQNSSQASNRCPSCFVEFGKFSAMAEHWSVDHRRVLYLYEGVWAEEKQKAAAKRKLMSDRKRGSRERKSVMTEGEKSEYYRIQKSLDYWRNGPGRGQPAIQLYSCRQTDESLPQCRECANVTRRDENDSSICQFKGFRKISSDGGVFMPAGFLHPIKDPTDNDRDIWAPRKDLLKVELPREKAVLILRCVGNEFCRLVREEEELVSDHTLRGREAAIWKRMEEQVREMCDVCSTTVFNVHFTCGVCCILVCGDCYRARAQERAMKHPIRERASKKKLYRPFRTNLFDPDEYLWPKCHGGKVHELSSLLLTKLICDDAHIKMRDDLHATKARLGIPLSCGCHFPSSRELDNHGPTTVKTFEPSKPSTIPSHSLDNEEERQTSIRKAVAYRKVGLSPKPESPEKRLSFEEVLASQFGPCKEFNVFDSKAALKSLELELIDGTSENDHFVSSPFQVVSEKVDFNTQSKDKHSVKHEWLCDGKLLLLEDPRSPDNMGIFQPHWRRGQPVLMANSSELLNADLWHPDSFLRDFGHLKQDLINCLNGEVVRQAPLRKFWRGFCSLGRRIKDSKGTPMLLKLKDWPPNDDIAEYMPDRFVDLFRSFPMPTYTLRDGSLNLASFLPDHFLKPELGPKMYIAYGSALYPDKGSTNLHIDMSDAVNCLVYVGLPNDSCRRDNEAEVYKEIDKAGCDILMKVRCRRLAEEQGKLPGALWHIFHPADTPKIRDLLKCVAIEKGRRLNPRDDPIHDQSTYLDGELRMRLYREYGVKGYTIVQCMGDTVFIPAGAAHQVRNLHNCIKVAEDFVSPENISHCIHLTQEFRHLTDWHTNHEDKLQVKSMMYHAVKSAVAVLKASEDHLATDRGKT